MTISIDQPNGMAPAREPDLAMRVVLIGESPSALAMVRIMRAQRGGAAFDCVGTQTLLDGLVAVDRDAPNCVIVDLELPDSVGLETLDVVLRHVPDVAVVALAGVDDHGAGRMAVSYGADDYLVKGTTDAGLMTRTLHRAIERKQTALTTRHDEARFRALLDVAPDAIMACDVNGLITLWNAGAEVTYGWPASEAIGQNMNELLAPGTDPDVFVRDLLHAGRWLVELQHRTKDGRSIDIEGQWTVLEDDHGRPIGLLGSNHDVTMRRSTQAELEENRAQLADLIDIAPDAIISIDEAQLITLFNQSAETIFGYSVDEVIGLSIEMLLPGKFVARQRSRLAESGRDQANHRRLSPRADIEGRRKDGALFPAEASISKLVRGDRVTYTVILRDVTARRQTDEALRSSEARLTAVLDTLPVGVIVARADGQPVYVNHHAREILGQPIEYGDDYRLVRSRYRVAGTQELYPEDR
ncbi:MAG: two-component system, sensor histidine kinase and response regulator [Acidimicrobiaceae bacterium]|nr:two-component system, sensor histidine kinase and response regulator [Acidimicrobiaceae bacterium]